MRRIRCLAGRIAVFRSRSDTELELYADAVTRGVAPDRFCVLVDGVSFDKEQHTIVDRGNVPWKNDETISSFLTRAGASPLSLPGLLLRFGLRGLEEKHCSDLSEGSAQMLQILSGTFDPERILLLKDPFGPITPEWREPLAEYLIECVAKRDALVVVLQLDYRPECWVENEYIARIPLERPRKPTIGFGDSAAIEGLAAVPSQKRSLFIRSVITSGWLALGLMLLLQKDPPSGPRRPMSAVAVQEHRDDTSSPPATIPGNSSMSPVSPIGPPGNPAPQAHPILDEYPIQVQRGVQFAFANPSSLLNYGNEERKEEEERETPRLEQLLQAMKENSTGQIPSAEASPARGTSL